MTENEVALTSKQALERATRLASRFEDDFIELGQLLMELKQRDHDLFDKVWRETRLSRRKAYYLADVARRIEDLPIPRERLAGIGWTKMQIIGKQISKQNWRRLLKLAETHTARELALIMKGEAPEPGGRTVVLVFGATDYQKFANALFKYGARPNGKGLLNKEQALLQIIDHIEKAKP